MSKNQLPKADNGDLNLPVKPVSLYWLVACKNCGHARHWHGNTGQVRIQQGTKCERKHDGTAPCVCPGYVEALDAVRGLFA